MTKHQHDSQSSHPSTKEQEQEQGNPSLTTPQPPLLEEMAEERTEAIPCQNSLEGLLKSPLWVIQKIEANEHLWQEGVFLLLWGLAFHALYGLAVGLFGGWDVAIMTTCKAPLIAVCSVGLCLPSLYIFACIGGIRITCSQAFALASSVVATVGLILLGLAPIAWLFSVSTESFSFQVVMTMCGWLIAMGFASRLLYTMKSSRTFRQTLGLKWWLVIYLIVSFQMSTTMRPLLTTPETGWWASGKKFFVVHFFESLEKDVERSQQ